MLHLVGDLFELSVIIARFWWNFHFIDRFSKKVQISNVIKNSPVRAELLHAELLHAELLYADERTGAQTDIHDQVNSRFSQFCERA